MSSTSPQAAGQTAGEHEIMFQNWFKSVGPRTYAAQVKKAKNGNHFLVLTEGKRDEKTGERSHYGGFTDLKDAESAKRQQEERPDQPGQVSVVTIETMLTGTFPEMYKPKG